MKFSTACSCSCGGAINKKFATQYQKQIDDYCAQNPPDRLCKMACDNLVIDCFKNKCVFDTAENLKYLRELNSQKK